MKRRFLKIVLRAVLVLLAATGFGQNPPTTAEGLIKEILTALQAKDQAALEKLTITEAEYKKYVWPNVAASANGSNAQKSWAMYQKINADGITNHLSEFGGHKLELVKVSFDSPIKQTKTYRLLSAPTVTVQDDSGKEKTVRLAGAVLEHDGGFNVANYHVRNTAAK